MKVSIIGRQMNVWNEMKDTIDLKLKKLDKYFSDECSATVTLSSKHNHKCLEITINASGVIFRSEVEDETFRNALDRAIYAIERQIRKNKTRLQRKLRQGAFDNGIFETNEDIEEEVEFTIREKTFFTRAELCLVLTLQKVKKWTTITTEIFALECLRL